MICSTTAGTAGASSSASSGGSDNHGGREASPASAVPRERCASGVSRTCGGGGPPARGCDGRLSSDDRFMAAIVSVRCRN
ncbi:hypothetical protein ACFFX0_01940 [Citricoccus parietis]|uniref:Uncharacterized protein n=1 Tax=Citricoccus parietis TaxID=592307 RepID=A0ABV5FTM3_9MICC